MGAGNRFGRLASRRCRVAMRLVDDPRQLDRAIQVSIILGRINVDIPISDASGDVKSDLRCPQAEAAILRVADDLAMVLRLVHRPFVDLNGRFDRQRERTVVQERSGDVVGIAVEFQRRPRRRRSGGGRVAGIASGIDDSAGSIGPVVVRGARNRRVTPVDSVATRAKAAGAPRPRRRPISARWVASCRGG